MLHVYEYSFCDGEGNRQCLALREELAYIARRLEDQRGWPEGTVDRLARLVITLHDVGKLDRRWQAWAHRWQKEVGSLRGEDLAVPDDYMAAHTDYDGQAEAEETLKRTLHDRKPNHAAESAQAVENLLWAHTGEETLVRAALTAITRHHSAGAAGGHGAFEAHPAAQAELAGVMDGLDPTLVQWSFPEGTLARKLMRPDREIELLIYLLLVRVLRLADQRSQRSDP
jgi:hypothetical protein